MFKTQVIRRSFSLYNRGAVNSQVLRSAARDGHETIRIQRVRFRKPLFGRSRLIGITVGAASAYAFLRWLEETPEEEAERKQEEELSRLRRAQKAAAKVGGEVTDEDDEDDEEEEDEPEAILFLPTGFSRPKPQTFYKGSDPEWQEFVRIAPDRQRIERIRSELIAMVRDVAAKNPSFKPHLGKINPAAGTSWIEFKFPDSPPREYERPGIEVTEDGTLRRATRPVNEIAHRRLANLLMPTAVAKSVYVDAKRRVDRTWRDFKTYLGYEDKSKTKVQNMMAQFPPQLPTKSDASPGTTTSSTSSTRPSPPSSSSTNGARQPPTSSTPPPEQEAVTPGDSGLERFGVALPKPTALTLDLSTFRASFRKERIRDIMRIQPPRGTFIVSGLVEVIGERARMTLDVAAAYDPKMARYVMIRMQIRSITQYRQDPKGGP